MDGLDKEIKRMYEASKGVDIHKMTVREFAVASQDNPLWNNSIWTKAYRTEEELGMLKDGFNRFISRMSMIPGTDRYITQTQKEMGKLLYEDS